MKRQILVIPFILIGLFYAFTPSCQNPQSTLGQNEIKVNNEHLDILTSNAISSNSLLKINEVGLSKLEIEKQMVSADHLSVFLLSGNMNEFNIQDISGTSSAPSFFPRYNIGINFRLNHFSQIKGKKKALVEDRKIIHHESELIIKDIKKNTLELYINYLKQKGNYNIQKSLESLSSIDFQTIEQKFADGQIEIDTYNRARKDLYLNRANLLNAESEYLLSKLELENYVGQTLQEMGIEN